MGSSSAKESRGQRGASKLPRLALCLGLAAALTLSLGVGGAAAHSKTYGSRTVIKNILFGASARPAQALGASPAGTNVTVNGRVKSRKGKCKKLRRVEVQATRSVQTRGSGASAETAVDRFIARTNKKGRFKARFVEALVPVVATAQLGVLEFTATARIKTKRFGHGKQHRCGAHLDEDSATPSAG